MTEVKDDNRVQENRGNMKRIPATIAIVLGSLAIAATASAAVTHPLHPVTQDGQLLYNFEALLYQNFGPNVSECPKAEATSTTVA